MNIRITPKKLNGTIDAIPSKSHAHRVLIAQKLAQMQGQRKVDALMIPTFSDDIGATKNCLVQMDKEMPFLDCKESGSTLRFLLPVAMALKEEAVFIGTGKLPDRPISPLKEEMEAHGCRFYIGSSDQKISDKYKEICTVTGRLQPGEYQLPGNISSQFITGLLFALPLLDGDSVLRLTTGLESAGYVDMTLAVLRDFGIEIKESRSEGGSGENGSGSGENGSGPGQDSPGPEGGLLIYEIPGRQRYIEPDGLTIEGDWSNASFWLACGALGGDITIRGLNPDSTQRDKEFLPVLEAMGAEVEIMENMESADTIDVQDAASSTSPHDCHAGVLIRCRGKIDAGSPDSDRPTPIRLQSTEVSVSQTPDMVPVLAAVMSVAEGASLITNAERLKIKESDRLRTVYDMLSKLGADISYGGSGLSLTGLLSLQGGEVESHNDHRIAMAAAVASCVCEAPVTIRGAEAVRKSYPDFFADFAALGGEITEY